MISLFTMAKTEDKIRNLLEEHYTKLKKEEELQMSSRVPGIFACGVFVGIVLSYSNLIGVLCGACMGAVVVVNYMGFVKVTMEKCSDFFGNIGSLFRTNNTEG